MKRIISMALAAATLVLSGCSIQPVYLNESRFGGVQMELRYAEPNSRLEQVAYQTISARIRTTENVAYPVLSLTVSTSSITYGVGGEIREPFSEAAIEITARIVARVTAPDGRIMFEDTRTASATYSTTGQYVGDDAARQGASERAVQSAADAIRLQLLAWGYYRDAGEYRP